MGNPALAKHKPIQTTPIENYGALVLAVVYQAALDLHSKNPACASEAKVWLRHVGISWCQMLGIQETQLAAWEEDNFNLPPTTHRNWRY
jgi:hypothetical protein